MNVVQRISPETVPGVRLVDSIDELKQIGQSDCAAVVWNRTISRDALNWVDQIDVDLLPSIRVILPPHQVCDAMSKLCDIDKTPKGPHRDWLVNDIATLAEAFADQTRTPYLRLRLSVVTTNACRKFHVDAITTRLICTYRGTGTQYGLSANGADPETVVTVRAGSPIVLRGRLWPNDPPSNVLHRSPPIEGSGETRLVLVLDPIFDPADED